MDMLTGVSVEEGVELLLRAAPAPVEEWIPVEQAAGRVLARDIFAPESLPPFARSPYDGYALRAEDVAHAAPERPVTLTVTQEIPAGSFPALPVERGQAAKILTGGPIPVGADLVVPFEVTQFTEERVTLFHPYPSGQNIVPVGEDVRAGDLVAQGGTVISPSMAGLLVGVGCAQVAVWRKPRVALFSTGSELMGPGEVLLPGKIRNSSVYALKAYLDQLGVEVSLLPTVGDEVEEIAAQLQAGAALADLVVTTGGLSVGDYDMLGRAVERLGAQVLFWKTKMKPGSAFLASLFQGKPILSLSGNPASAALSFFMLGIPLLRKMSGRKDWMLEPIQVRLAQAFPKKSPGRRFIPGRLTIVEGQACISLSQRQANGMLSHLDGCDLIGEIPPGSPPMEAGGVIRAYRLF